MKIGGGIVALIAGLLGVIITSNIWRGGIDYLTTWFSWSEIFLMVATGLCHLPFLFCDFKYVCKN